MSDRRKSATPYELYTSSSSNSRFRLGGGGGDGSSVFLPPSSSNTPVRRYGAGEASFSPGSARSLIQDSSPFRRNVPFGSPGPRAAPAMSEAARSAGRASLPPNDDAGTPFGSKGSAARKRFVRRKPLKERLATFPIDLYHSLSLQFSLYLSDIQELPPQAGFILGGLLHFLSVLAHIISPDSDFRVASSLLRRGSRGSRKQRTLFASEKASGVNILGSGAVSGTGGAAGTVNPAEHMRRIAQLQRDSWLRGMSILLSLAALVLASYNAYVLFMRSRRRYQLLMKSQDDVVKSENAKLVPLAQDPEDKPCLQERFLEMLLSQLRKVPVAKWFVPRDYAAWRARRGADAKMHALDVWQSPELNLSIFCVYTPVHALWYHFAGLLGIRGPVSWITTWLVMAGMGFQLYWVVHEFQALLKDRQLIAGEVMNEYEQKFVFPRAMPAMADASTMTNEAEMTGWRAYHTGLKSTPQHLSTGSGSGARSAGRKSTSASTPASAKGRKSKASAGGDNIAPW